LGEDDGVVAAMLVQEPFHVVQLGRGGERDRALALVGLEGAPAFGVARGPDDELGPPVRAGHGDAVCLEKLPVPGPLGRVFRALGGREIHNHPHGLIARQILAG
jgi:hypothetical protein